MKIQEKRNCKNDKCGKEFVSTNGRQVFCSHFCSRSLLQRSRREKINEYNRNRLKENPEKVRAERLAMRKKWLEKPENREKVRTLSRKAGDTGEPVVGDDDIIFYGYKEPLKKYEGGFGYYGVVAYSKSRGRVQCHECGKFFKMLNNGHLGKIHNTTAREYKDKMGLSQTSALIGEDTREKLLHRLDDVSPEWFQKKKEDIMKVVRNKKIQEKKAHPPISLEVKNKRGTCPDQLLQKIKDLEQFLGVVPTIDDFTRHYNKYYGSIRRTFGTWENAVKLAGFQPTRDAKREKFSKEKLLEYLKQFFEANQRTPVESDFSRGLLPNSGVYRRNFGTLNNARMAAGIPVTIPVLGRYYVESKISGK